MLKKNLILLNIFLFRINYLARLINDFKSTDFVSKFRH